MPRIPIIGLGAICSAGAGVAKGWEFVASGRDGLSAWKGAEPSLAQEPLCAQVPEKDLQIAGASSANRTIACAYAAAREATRVLENRHKSLGLRLGVVTATTVAGVCRSEVFYRSLLANPAVASKAATELKYHDPSTLSAALAERFEAQLTMSISTACSAGLHAVGLAGRLIERGMCDLCLAVGADALSLLTVHGFASLLLLAPGGCTPFSKGRAGISLGEGAGALLLASSSAAMTLGVPPLAFLAGWGASADCHHMTAPHPEGRGAIAAIRTALTKAGVEPNHVDFVAAHGTGTPDNDLAEITALRAVFGDRIPPFCSMKRSLGHTLGASGALESVFAIMAMRNQWIPPTAGFTEPDNSLGTKPSAGERRPIRTLLKNAFGFGGNNAAAVFVEARV